MELAWNFFMDLESTLYKTYFTQKVKTDITVRLCNLIVRYCTRHK